MQPKFLYISYDNARHFRRNESLQISGFIFRKELIRSTTYLKLQKWKLIFQMNLVIKTKSNRYSSSKQTDAFTADEPSQ